MENWEPVKLIDKGVNWGEFYEVSTEGQVRNRKTKQIRKLNCSNSGYLYLTLTKKLENGKKVTKWVHVHRLVALTFIPNPTGLPCINHKDERRFNNSIENLEWCDTKYNNSYGTRLDRISNRNNRRNIPIPIVKIDSNGKVVAVYDSICNAAAVKENPSYSSIYKAINGINGRKTAGGYIWKKVEEN